MKMKISRRRFCLTSGFLTLGSTWVFGETMRPEDETFEGITICQLTNKTPTQMMSYIIQTHSGELIVVDGGNAGDADHLLEMLEKMNGKPNPCVSAWFLTHCHSDHVGALCELIRSNRLPEVKKFYFHFPPAEWLNEGEPGCIRTTTEFYRCAESIKNRMEETHKNQELSFENLRVTVLNDPYLDLHHNPINNTSVCFLFRTPKSSLIFLGDLGAEASLELLKTQPAEVLKADAVQMAHHGQSGAARELYDAIAPRICFWPTPNWLWNNDSGKGPDSGPWSIRNEQRWMKELGVAENYIGKDGTVCVRFLGAQASSLLYDKVNFE